MNDNKKAILELSQWYRRITVADLKAALENYHEEDLEYWATRFSCKEDNRYRVDKWKWVQIALNLFTGFHSPACPICDSVPGVTMNEDRCSLKVDCNPCLLSVIKPVEIHDLTIFPCNHRQEYKDLLNARTFQEMKAAMNRAADKMEELCNE